MFFLGRSNVGKSSFINALTNRKKILPEPLPNQVRLLPSIYLIDNSFYLVDVPGYGYASRSLEQGYSLVILLMSI